VCPFGFKSTLNETRLLLTIRYANDEKQAHHGLIRNYLLIVDCFVPGQPKG
jgi:hypothetical protein